MSHLDPKVSARRIELLAHIAHHPDQVRGDLMKRFPQPLFDKYASLPVHDIMARVGIADTVNIGLLVSNDLSWLMNQKHVQRNNTANPKSFTYRITDKGMDYLRTQDIAEVEVPSAGPLKQGWELG